jgi:hypothetical protein
MDECAYCGTPGCHWSRHPEARADVARWEAEVRGLEFPFGDHVEDC